MQWGDRPGVWFCTRAICRFDMHHSGMRLNSRTRRQSCKVMIVCQREQQGWPLTHV